MLDLIAGLWVLCVVSLISIAAFVWDEIRYSAVVGDPDLLARRAGQLTSTAYLPAQRLAATNPSSKLSADRRCLRGL